MSVNVREQRPGRICANCSERRQVHLFPKLAPGKYGDVCKSCTKATGFKRKLCDVCHEPRLGRQFRDLGGYRSTTCMACDGAPAVRPSGRICAACEKRKTVHSFRRVSPGVYYDLCRVCEKAGEIFVPRPPKGRRLCACCGIERGRDRFETRDGVTAQCCDLCTDRPEIRVTLRQQDAAAIVLRRLAQIAAGRLDAVAGMPTLGVDGLRELARQALTAVEAARS